MTTARIPVVVPAAAAGLLGAAGVAAWLTGRMVFASAHATFIPMAPITGLTLLVLSSALLLLGTGRARRLAGTAGAIVAVSAVVKLVALLGGGTALYDIEPMLVRNPGAFGDVPLARISPVTAVGLAAVGAAIFLLACAPQYRSSRHAAGALGTVTAAIGGTVVLGYVYRTPLLYGGSVIPVALPTGLALVSAGAATLLLAGRRGGWPARAFRGPTARARLLRAFLPAVAAAFLPAGAIDHWLVYRTNANPALAAAVSAIAAAAVSAVLVSRIAGSLGGAIDRAEQALRQSHQQLERAVAVRTTELRRTNEELEAFSYSVSHDLRAPLRHITGFAALLQKHASARLDEQDQRYMRTIVDAAARMSGLIDDLLSFSRMGRSEMLHATVDLDALVAEVVAEEAKTANGRRIEWRRTPIAPVAGDRAMLRVALSNLVSNAVKYTAPRDPARIEIGALPSSNGERILFVRDNGVGFDMKYAGKLFGVFQRLHASEEFEGTGIGLANVRRVVHRHGGRTWAEGAPDQGATFYVALPAMERTAS